MGLDVLLILSVLNDEKRKSENKFRRCDSTGEVSHETHLSTAARDVMKSISISRQKHGVSMPSMLSNGV
jgi:hypothetical protein